MAIAGGALWALIGGLVLAGIVFPDPGLPLLVLLVLLVVVAIDVALAPGKKAVQIRRETGQSDVSVRLGEATRSTLAVVNLSSRSLRLWVRDLWVPSAGAQPSRHRLRIPGGQQRWVETRLLPTRRGERRSSGVAIRSLGPLRLGARQWRVAVPGAVRVLPAFTSRKHLPSRLKKLHEIEGKVAVLLRGAGTEFDSLREYVVGDDVRAIDWRSTARRGDVLVRTWRPERDRRVLIVVDTSRTSAARVGDAPRLDAAMEAALLLAALASRAGDRVDLLAYDRQVRAHVQGAKPHELLARLVEALAPLEPELLEADMHGMVSTIMARTPRRTLVVLLTGLEPTAMEEGLLPALPHMVERHHVVVASVADPQVVAMAARRGDISATYDAAAAQITLLQRDNLRAHLSRMGVDTVEAPPGELAPALADRYLALKAAGRL